MEISLRHIAAAIGIIAATAQPITPKSIYSQWVSPMITPHNLLFAGTILMCTQECWFVQNEGGSFQSIDRNVCLKESLLMLGVTILHGAYTKDHTIAAYARRALAAITIKTLGLDKIRA